MNELLHGHNPLPRVVAVHPVGDSSVRIYQRKDGKTSPRQDAASLTHHDREFFPFFFLESDRYLEGFPRQHWIKRLEGRNFFRYAAAFSRWSELWEAVRHVMQRYNASATRRIDNYSALEILHLRPDPVTQFLLQSGITHFKRMQFAELSRMQVDVETYSKEYRFSDYRKTDDRIILIALSDTTGWEHVIDGRKKSEPEMLAEFLDIVAQRDPDVLEGHNISAFDLPYIVHRCRLHGVDCVLGRDGSTVKSAFVRFSAGEAEQESTLFEVNGRHIVDTLTLAQAHDAGTRSLESYNLKYLARHFGFLRSDRVVIPGNRISWYWDHEPEVLVQYALDDVRDTRQLSELLSPGYFFLAQMCPLSYATLIRSGSASKIESLMLREYLFRKHSVPRPQHGAQNVGGYADIFYTGLFSPIVHADVESLYPSIILSKNIIPRSDELGIFTALLRELVSLRLEAKRAMQRATDEKTRTEFHALQSSYKILINSFYGYLGYARALFNDYQQADRVTATGQEYLRHTIHQVDLHNGTVIEVDTDGLFFVPPDNVRGAEEEHALVQRLSDSLPEGITLALSGRYKRMLSYKKKNYALLDYDNRLTVRGSAFTSRSMERFLRQFLRQCVECLLREDIDGLHRLYVSLANDIREHRLQAHDFCKTETLRDSLDRYEREVAEGTRNRSAAYEAAKRAGAMFKPPQTLSYYVTGSEAGVTIADHSRLVDEWDPNFPDENVAYYLSRLDETSQKLEVFFEPSDFKRIFSQDDLFGFSAEGIRIQSRKVQAGGEPVGRVEEDRGEFGIWLDEEKPASDNLF